MCGIVGYIGKNSALETLLAGLERLEYRGYDSAGVALVLNDVIDISREVGRLKGLREIVEKRAELQEPIVGIGHTRWATHGGPSEVNAHPHRSETLALVHNGIVENYSLLREELESKGYKFSSETDTEVATHLLHYIMQEESDFNKFMQTWMGQIEGSFAFVAVDAENPKRLLVAKKESPMVLGLGERENFIASDVTALLDKTRKVIYLEDGDYAEVTNDTVSIYNQGNLVDREIHEIEWDLNQAQKGGFEHFMIKEIYDQPKAVNDTLSGRLVENHKNFKLPELDPLREKIPNLQRIKLIACGTASYACLIGKYYFEQLAKIPCDVEIASEFRYQNPIISDDELLISVSQSGETADTLAAINLVKDKCPTVAVTNVLGSTITRTVDHVVLTQAGPEISVASTKAFLTQVLVLYMMALKFADLRKTINQEELARHMGDIMHLSSMLSEVLEQDRAIAKLAEKYLQHQGYFYLGRGSAFPIALEGALKLKEITYLHAEGYPAGELKHGPIALISPEIPTVAILQREEPFFSKVISNLNEVKSRDGKLILVTDSEDLTEINKIATDVIQLPYRNDYLTPLLAVVPMQLFAYHVARLKEREIDFPRNLAKSVTVE